MTTKINLGFMPKTSSLSCTKSPMFQLLSIDRVCSQYAPRRAFSTTVPQYSWLVPRGGRAKKSMKGRCRVPTGGSTHGTTVVWGDYGLRMRDHDRRVSAAQLACGAEAIKKRLRGQRYRLYTRVSANIGVYTKGNESRMGTGKGTFDHYAARIAVSRIIFELKGEMHERVIMDAFRLAANALPGLYEVAKKGDPPVMGLTKVENGATLEDIKRPWTKSLSETHASSLPVTKMP